MLNVVSKSRFYRGYFHGAILSEKSKTCFANPNGEAGRYIYQLRQCESPEVYWLVIPDTSIEAESDEAMAIVLEQATEPYYVTRN